MEREEIDEKESIEHEEGKDKKEEVKNKAKHYETREDKKRR